MRIFQAIALPCLLAAACGSSVDDPGPGDVDVDSGVNVDGGGGGGGGGPDATNPSSNARLVGTLTRSAAPQGDAVGNVYVALFDRDPVANMMTAQLVANALVQNANLAAPGASAAYVLEGVPPRAEKYYLIAFLDDNGNVDMSNPGAAGPDRGDLVSLEGLSAPTVTVPTAAEMSHNIVLNQVMPF